MYTCNVSEDRFLICNKDDLSSEYDAGIGNNAGSEELECTSTEPGILVVTMAIANCFEPSVNEPVITK